MNMAKKINEASVIHIVDDTNFEAGMCCNGGHYRQTVSFRRSHLGGWERRETSSYEDACPYCGDSDCSGRCPIVTVSPAEMLEEIREAIANPGECRYYPGENAISVFFSD